MAKIKEEERKAEIEVKVNSLRAKREIEQQKLELRLKEEELKLQEELQISKAKTDAFNKLKEERDPYPPSFAGSRRSRHESRDSTISSNASVNALQSIVKHLKKPLTEIKKFGGDPLEYQRFLRQFKTRIIANCEDYDERLNYLEQYTTGDAHKIVTGYSYLNSEKGYKAALRELELKYGDVDVIVNAFVKRAISWPTIKGDNAKALDDFAMFLAECENAVDDLQAVRVL